MISSLNELKRDISVLGKLVTLYGENTDCVSECIDTWKIDAVYWNKDYTPYAKKRDSKLKILCNKKNIAIYEEEITISILQELYLQEVEVLISNIHLI